MDNLQRETQETIEFEQLGEMGRNSNNEEMMKNARKYGKKKNIYFDSNDEMYFESELSEEDIILNGKDGHRNFTKV